ncbi:MAG TPA: hypothetical protein VFZ42_11285 [Chitinophagaceae bacterium]
MKINIFKPESTLYPLRWIIVWIVFLSAFMLYHDLTGGRMFGGSKQEQWQSKGAGYHK